MWTVMSQTVFFIIRISNSALRTGGREVQCTGLQILKTGGSNPSLCSRVSPYSIMVLHPPCKREIGGSIPSEGTKHIGDSPSWSKAPDFDSGIPRFES